MKSRRAKTPSTRSESVKLQTSVQLTSNPLLRMHARGAPGLRLRPTNQCSSRIDCHGPAWHHEVLGDFPSQPSESDFIFWLPNSPAATAGSVCQCCSESGGFHVRQKCDGAEIKKHSITILCQPRCQRRSRLRVRWERGTEAPAPRRYSEPTAIEAAQTSSEKRLRWMQRNCLGIFTQLNSVHMVEAGCR